VVGFGVEEVPAHAGQDTKEWLGHGGVVT